jgi:hypothetical protein
MNGETVFALYAWDVDALLHNLGGQGKVQVLRVVDDFSPGVFKRLRLNMHLPAAAFNAPRQHLERYLADAYVPYSLRREEASAVGATRYRFDLPAKGLKKKVLLGGHFELSEAGFDACLEAGVRFDLLALLDRFDRVNAVHYTELSCSDIRW